VGAFAPAFGSGTFAGVGAFVLAFGSGTFAGVGAFAPAFGSGTFAGVGAFAPAFGSGTFAGVGAFAPAFGSGTFAGVGAFAPAFGSGTFAAGPPFALTCRASRLIFEAEARDRTAKVTAESQVEETILKILSGFSDETIWCWSNMKAVLLRGNWLFERLRVVTRLGRG